MGAGLLQELGEGTGVALDLGEIVSAVYGDRAGEALRAVVYLQSVGALPRLSARAAWVGE